MVRHNAYLKHSAYEINTLIEIEILGEFHGLHHLLVEDLVVAKSLSMDLLRCMLCNVKRPRKQSEILNIPGCSMRMLRWPMVHRKWHQA